MKTILLGLFILVILPYSLFASTAEDALFEKARQLKLHNERYWQVLLHYKSSLFGQESEIDSQSFFLSSSGKFNPEAELQATIKSFLAPFQPDTVNDHAICRYRARFRWLEEQLEISKYLHQIPVCQEYNAWRSAMQPESVVLVFPAYDLYKPGSMFGHTLLKIQSKNGSALLSYAVTFGAAVDDKTEHTFLLVVKGLFGLYDSGFSYFPYYEKVTEYLEGDVRDMWEYELALKPEEIDRLIDHLWEMRWALFDYYFFGENCSYHLLSLFDIARPTAYLQESFPFAVTPTDTIRRTIQKIGTVGDPIYRPSRYSRFLTRRDRLNDSEKAHFKRAVADLEYIGSPSFQALSDQSQAKILDLMIDIYRLKKSSESRLTSRALIKKRAHLKVILPEVEEAPRSTPPHLGHETAKLYLGGATDRHQIGSQMVGFRFSFHDLLDSPVGFNPNSQIDFGNYLVRHRDNEWFLQHFHVIDIYSILPHSEALNLKAWRLRVGWEWDKTIEEKTIVPFQTLFGIGFAEEFGFFSTYHLATARIQHSYYFEGQYRVMAGIENGARFQIGELMRVQVQWNYFSRGDQDNFHALKFETSFQPTDQSEIRIGLEQADTYRESSIFWNLYF